MVVVAMGKLKLLHYVTSQLVELPTVCELSYFGILERPVLMSFFLHSHSTPFLLPFFKT